MNIEKRKVTEAKPLSVAAKSAMGVMLGVTTAATFIACGGPMGEVSDVIDENSSSSDEIQTPKSDSSSPESSNQAEGQQSNSEQAETKQSSSSKIVDIPLSHEPISSSVLEAISSAPESSSSAAEPASATDSPTSSSADTASSAADPASSSETVQPESSSETVEPASSASQPTEQELKDACQGSPGGTSVDIGGQVYLCPDTGGGMMFSMISTFERTDAEV